MSATTGVTTKYLITGTTRGIGYALVAALLLRPNTIVFAGVRDPTNASPGALSKLPKAPGTALHILKIDSLCPTDAKDAVTAIQRDHGITSLDVVIANAGIFSEFAPILSADPEAVNAHFQVNVLGTLRLLQAAMPLLVSASNEEGRASPPRFVVTTSALGSTTMVPDVFDLPAAAYGVAKASINHLLRRASAETPSVAFLFFHPNLVASDMGNELAERVPVWKGMVMKDMMISVGDGVKGYLELIDKPTSETADKFLDITGNALPW